MPDNSSRRLWHRVRHVFSRNAFPPIQDFDSTQDNCSDVFEQGSDGSDTSGSISAQVYPMVTSFVHNASNDTDTNPSYGECPVLKSAFKVLVNNCEEVIHIEVEDPPRDFQLGFSGEEPGLNEDICSSSNSQSENNLVALQQACQEIVTRVSKSKKFGFFSGVTNFVRKMRGLRNDQAGSSDAVGKHFSLLLKGSLEEPDDAHIDGTRGGEIRGDEGHVFSEAKEKKD